MTIGFHPHGSVQVRTRQSRIEAHASLQRGAAALLLAWLTAGTAWAATYTVTTNADAGAGSLRQAILAANANAGADTIVFDAAVTGTITLTSGQLLVTDA